jgi:DNA-binding MarR family transcriptional regulator
VNDFPSDKDLASFAEAIVAIANHLRPRGEGWRNVVDLTGTEVTVIREVQRTPGCTPTHMSRVTGLRRSNVSTAIRQLESRGMLVRVQDGDDARTYLLHLTDLARQSISLMRSIWVEMLRDLDPDVVSTVIKSLPDLELLATELKDPLIS